MMAAYLANQIIIGKLAYAEVVEKRPDLMDKVDQSLRTAGRADLIP